MHESIQVRGVDLVVAEGRDGVGLLVVREQNQHIGRHIRRLSCRRVHHG